MKMMKSMSMLFLPLLVLAGGCRSTSGWTEETIGMGEYRVDVPHITDIIGQTNNPTILVHECGRIQVRVHSFADTRSGDIWINWIEGTVRDETTTNTVEQSSRPVPK